MLRKENAKICLGNRIHGNECSASLSHDNISGRVSRPSRTGSATSTTPAPPGARATARACGRTTSLHVSNASHTAQNASSSPCGISPRRCSPTRGGLYAGLEVEQGRDTLMEFYTGALPEELERLKPE